MIYLDSSVALAHLLAEDRRPPADIWNEAIHSSRLLQYEVAVRLNARNLQRSHAGAASALLARVSIVELAPEVLARALEPFPIAVRSLDALHLASMNFLVGLRQRVRLASYDKRLNDAATLLGIELFEIN